MYFIFHIESTFSITQMTVESIHWSITSNWNEFSFIVQTNTWSQYHFKCFSTLLTFRFIKKLKWIFNDEIITTDDDVQVNPYQLYSFVWHDIIHTHAHTKEKRKGVPSKAKSKAKQQQQKDEINKMSIKIQFSTLFTRYFYHFQ